MEKAIRRLFNLYPGEIRKASLFLILGFLWALGGYGGFTLSEGLFLENVGAHALPAAYFSIALGMCLLSCLLIYALARLPIHHILVYVIVGSTLAELVFYFLLTSSSVGELVGFWYAFKVISWVVPISTYICFWAFIDQYFDLQDGKRFFCLFNSITFLGDACSGGIISLALKPLGISGLLALFIFIMLASLPFIFLIKERVATIPEEHGIQKKGQKLAGKRLKSILSSRFTIILMLFYFVMQLLAITTEYNYMTTFERLLSQPGSTHVVTQFLGTCVFWISLGNMVFGFFLYSRLVQKMGVNNIILVAPAFFMMVFFFWFYRDALPVALLGLIAREGMVYTFDDNNLVLLISGVPSKVKNQVRIGIESFFEPVGMFVSAALLLLFQNESKWLGLTLSISALTIVFFLRAEYPKAIFSNLVAGTIRFEKRAAEWLSSFSKREKKEVELLLLSNLRKVDEPIQLLAYEYLLKIGNPRVLRRLLVEFGRFTLPGKLKAIELIGDSPWAQERVVIERFERLRVASPHPSLNSAIHFYFARQGVIRPEKMVDYLDSAHLGLQGAAILALKTKPSYAVQANKQLDRLLNSSDSSEICVALRILECERSPSNQELILSFLKHPSLAVNRAAAKALSASTRNEVSQTVVADIISLLPQMRDSEVRLYALESLENLENVDSICALILASVHFRPKERKAVERIVWGMGDRALPTLIDMTMGQDIHARCRLLAGKILGKLSLPDLRANLYPIVRREIEKAYFYFYHWHTIQRQVPEHDLFILENTLLASYESILDFIVQLLGVAGSIEESDVLSHTLRSKNKKTQAQAHETLEKTCDPRIFSLLAPLIKNKSPEAKVHDYLKGGRIPLNFTQLLEVLAHSPIPAEQIVAITLKARLDAPGWRKILEKKMQDDEKTLRSFARQLLEVEV